MVEKTVAETAKAEVNHGARGTNGNNANSANTAKNTENAIEISKVTKRYGKLTAVNNIDMTVPAGQVLAFLGPNGAGKSTVNEMILGLVKSDAGKIKVFGRTPQQAVREGLVGAMLQNGPLLDSVNVKQTLKIVHALHSHPLSLDEVIERADLKDILKTQTKKLSGGQAQRVRFALAILPNPRLILLDEPTVAMDVERRHRFWAQIGDFAAAGRTIMFSTHYLEEADEIAERIVMLESGKIAQDGTGASIKAHTGGKKIRFRGDTADYEKLPGVVSVVEENGVYQLISNSSDDTLRALLNNTTAHEITVSAPTLEDVFLNLAGGK